MRHRPISILAVSAVAVIATVRLSAIFFTPETSTVPVARLVENLERDLKADPKNVDLMINLARLHGMAYALKTETAIVARWPDKREEPFYGQNPDLIPYKPIDAPAPAADIPARDHLKKAIAYYAAALAIDPANRLALLGHGWALEQAGEKARAVAQYRQVIKEAWVAEERQRLRMPNQRYFTYEAATYLIPLLDPVRDADEIADLRAKQKLMDERPRAITPIAVPLADNVPAHAIAAPQLRIAFDADGTGVRRQWTWIGPQAGWLVHDPARRGEITSALQWFGNVTFWLFWGNGYEALAALDDDASGDLMNDELRDLAIWHDRNANGISEAGEVRSLAGHGIVGLSCRYVEGDGVSVAAQSTDGARLTSGRTRPTYDIILSHVPAPTVTMHVR